MSAHGAPPNGANVLEIDPAALAAEAERALASAPASAAEAQAPLASGDDAGELETPPGHEPTMAELQAIAGQSAAGLVFLVDRAAAITVPNWGITPAESKELGEAAAVAMAAWFPDGVIPIKYVVLLNLAGSAYAIAEKRRDPATGGYLPRKVAPPAEARTDGAAATA